MYSCGVWVSTKREICAVVFSLFSFFLFVLICQSPPPWILWPKISFGLTISHRSTASRTCRRAAFFFFVSRLFPIVPWRIVACGYGPLQIQRQWNKLLCSGIICFATIQLLCREQFFEAAGARSKTDVINGCLVSQIEENYLFPEKGCWENRTVIKLFVPKIVFHSMPSAFCPTKRTSMLL